MTRGPLNFKHIKPYLHNFGVFHEILTNHFGRDLSKLKVLEVGAGRGTFSHYLKNFGIDPICLDLQDKLIYSHLNYVQGDVFDLPFKDEEFDLVFTYGLLEHFNMSRQIEAIKKMLCVSKLGGLNVHYIVPMKLTNIFEDKNVYRDSCNLLRSEFDMQWVFPIITSRWRTNKWLGKGAFFTLEPKV